MHIIGYRLEPSSNDSMTLVLMLDGLDMEFSAELGSNQGFYNKISTICQQYITKQIKGIKIDAVKLMVGTMLIATIPIQGFVLPVMTEAVTPQTVQAQNINRFNMSYIYFGSYESQMAHVQMTGQSLDVVSPSYFDLDDLGRLKLNYVDEHFIRTLHAQNIRVVPFISNHWNQAKGIMALKNREALATQVAAAINQYSLDGINIDIENVTKNERDAYTDFVRLIREKLPAHKEVSVSVAANPNNKNVGWVASYDYAALAQYSDYLMVMAYDQSYAGSASGAVAGHDFVEKSIQYALKYVSNDKIVLGIPFYGRYWKNGAPYGGYGIHLQKIEQLIQSHYTRKWFDTPTQSPLVSITIGSNEPPEYIFGQRLEPGTYTIWYEDEMSIKDKLQLVQKYNLKGTGSWSLGQESPSLWGYYDLWLNSQYFYDVNQSWAQDDILRIVQKGWMTGTGQDVFSPAEELSRAQAAMLFSRILDLQPKEGVPLTFTDIRSDHWANDAIALAVQNNIMQGMSDTTFAPDAPLTRAELTMLLYRILEHQTTPTQAVPYTDIPVDAWFYKPVAVMTETEAFKGTSATTFSPNEAMTREQMATVLARLADELEKVQNSE